MKQVLTRYNSKTHYYPPPYLRYMSERISVFFKVVSLSPIGIFKPLFWYFNCYKFGICIYNNFFARTLTNNVGSSNDKMMLLSAWNWQNIDRPRDLCLNTNTHALSSSKKQKCCDWLRMETQLLENVVHLVTNSVAGWHSRLFCKKWISQLVLWWL